MNFAVFRATANVSVGVHCGGDYNPGRVDARVPVLVTRSVHVSPDRSIYGFAPAYEVVERPQGYHTDQHETLSSCESKQR